MKPSSNFLFSFLSHNSDLRHFSSSKLPQYMFHCTCRRSVSVKKSGGIESSNPYSLDYRAITEDMKKGLNSGTPWAPFTGGHVPTMSFLVTKDHPMSCQKEEVKNSLLTGRGPNQLPYRLRSHETSSRNAELQSWT